MKYLSKINRGVLLTLTVVLAVTGYLVANTLIHNGEKPAIRQACESYIQKEVSYNMLPVASRVDNPTMTATALDNYLAQMKKDLIAYYPANEQYYKFVIDNLTSDLTNQAKGLNVVYSYDKTVLRYDDMLFDGDTVDVRFTCSTSIEVKSDIGTGSAVKDKVTSETQDNIILQKINGSWKVVFASLNRPVSNNPVKAGVPVGTNGKF